MNDTFEMTRAELEEKRDNQAILLDQEVQRRTEMAQRVVKRMLKGSLYALFLHIYIKSSLFSSMHCWIISTLCSCNSEHCVTLSIRNVMDV